MQDQEVPRFRQRNHFSPQSVSIILSTSERALAPSPLLPIWNHSDRVKGCSADRAASRFTRHVIGYVFKVIGFYISSIFCEILSQTHHRKVGVVRVSQASIEFFIACASVVGFLRCVSRRHSFSRYASRRGKTSLHNQRCFGCYKT